MIAQGGAKNFAVVMPDADIDRTVAACMTSFFGNAGQRCLANANLSIIGEGLSEAEYEAFYQEVVTKFIAAASRITIGNGLDEAVQMGPLRDPGKKQRVAQVHRARSGRGRPAAAGRAPVRDPGRLSGGRLPGRHGVRQA